MKYRQTNARHAFEDLVSRAGYGFVWVPVDPRFTSSVSSTASITTTSAPGGFDPMNPMGAAPQVQPISSLSGTDIDAVN